MAIVRATMIGVGAVENIRALMVVEVRRILSVPGDWYSSVNRQRITDETYRLQDDDHVVFTPFPKPRTKQDRINSFLQALADLCKQRGFVIAPEGHDAFKIFMEVVDVDSLNGQIALDGIRSAKNATREV